MTEKDKLTQIVKKVQQNPGEFEQLYSYIIDKVYFWSYTIIGNDADAKDLAQIAMIQIYQGIQTLKNPKAFNSWMYQLIKNVSLNYIRKHKNKEFEFSQNEDGESYEVNVKEERRDNIPDTAYDLKETKKLIRSFIDNLPDMQREVITLYYLEEMKISEISEVLKSTSGAVKGSLHKGRKSIELQIDDYQKRHHVKLYTVTLLPLLGLILAEYRNELCSKQDLHFDKGKYIGDNISTVGNLASMMSVKVVSALLAVTIIASIIGYSYANQNNSSILVNDFDDIHIIDIPMFNKANNNPYIENIVHSTFPTRSSLRVEIKLKVEIEADQISILYGKKELDYIKNEKNMILEVESNGKYTIIINNKKVSFDITTIDPLAPELIDINYYENYISLNIVDELSQIDYGLSYIEYKGKQYDITKDLKVIGYFNDDIVVNVYINENSYRKYFVKY